jgi:hypothetical protein
MKQQTYTPPHQRFSSNTKSKMGGTLIWEGYDIVMSKKTPILMYLDTIPKKDVVFKLSWEKMMPFDLLGANIT